MIIKIRIRPKQLAAILVSICLVLVLVLSACTTEEATPATTSTPSTSTPSTSTTAPPATQIVTEQIDKVYKVLNPTGLRIPVECSACAPRLDTLAGKTILYYQSEANPVIMPCLLERLKEDYLTTTFDVLYTESFGSSSPTEEQIETYDAVIRGISW